MQGITPAGLAVQVESRRTRRPAMVDAPRMARHLIGLLRHAGLSTAEIARVGREMPTSKSAAHRSLADVPAILRGGDDDE